MKDRDVTRSQNTIQSVFQHPRRYLMTYSPALVVFTSQMRERKAVHQYKSRDLEDCTLTLQKSLKLPSQLMYLIPAQIDRCFARID